MEDKQIVDLYWQRSDLGHIGNESEIRQILPHHCL